MGTRQMLRARSTVRITSSASLECAQHAPRADGASRFERHLRGGLLRQIKCEPGLIVGGKQGTGGSRLIDALILAL